jgi:hypothetical protein
MKNRISFLIVLILILTGCSNGRVKNYNCVKEENYYSDKFTISIGEDYFNLFLNKTGELSGEQKVKRTKLFKIIKIDNNLKWKIREMKLDIEEGETNFSGKVLIEIDGQIIDSSFKSKVNFEYSNEEEKLKIIPVEMRIKKLANIDIVNFYSPIFEVKVANPFNKDVKLKMPDGSYKSILINTEAVIKTEKDRIEITMKYIN